jgi:parvulin-like peptidyl-prolyl isomerase
MKKTLKQYFTGGKADFWRQGGLIVGVLVILLFFVSVIFFYTAPRDNAVVRNVTSVMPYPIIFVGSSVITQRDLTTNMQSVRRFYENQDFSSLGLRVDFGSAEGQKRLQVREREVLNKMIEDDAVRQIAEKKGITVSEEDVKNDLKKRIDEYGTGSEVTSNLERLYGWSLKDFAKKVVTPSLYQDKLTEVYAEEVKQDEALTRITAAEQALKAGKSFADVAKENSSGNTAATGGELGWFQEQDVAPELQASVKSAVVGQPTGVLESALGFHIILVNEVKDEAGVKLYRLSQIFAPKVTYSEWLTGEIQKLSVHVMSPLYRWNHDHAEVEFANEGWQQVEQELYKNATDDALFTR